MYSPKGDGAISIIVSITTIFLSLCSRHAIMATALSPVTSGTRPISTKRYALPPPIVTPFETFQLSVLCFKHSLANFSPHAWISIADWHEQEWHEHI